MLRQGDLPSAYGFPPECAFVELVVGVDDPRDEDIRALLEVHLAFSRGATPAEYSFALDAEQLATPGVTFFGVAGRGLWSALRRLDEDHAELKSMHTRETERGQGVGRAMVEHVLSFARREGYRRVNLETGATDGFASARALYTSVGFRPCGAFSDYRPSPYNTFMTINLDP